MSASNEPAPADPAAPSPSSLTGYRVAMPAVWTERHRLHEPQGEVWVGVRIPGTEVPQRGEVIRAALETAGAPLLEMVDHGLDPVYRVHRRSLVDYLEHAYRRWVESGLDREPGQDRVVPYAFPLPQIMDGRGVREPASISALAGRFAMDTMTLIGPGTFEAARASVDCALTAADHLLAGAAAAYAACRPPGHHAGAEMYGGSCYLNNAAVAVQWLRDHDVGPVAVIDLDAHHGNGTQQIFYDRSDVFYGSLHVDPGAGWFPHFVGFADEMGEGAGSGCNRNLPLAPGTGTEAWVGGVAQLVEEVSRFAPEAVAVSLGVDGASADPESPLQVERPGFWDAGGLIAGLGVPTLFVQEGGYRLEELGDLVVAVLAGWEGERSR